MPANRLSMRKIKEVLRLKWANNLSDRKIAQRCNISRPAVVSYVERATLPDWIDSHQRAFAFFGGLPEVVVPDNLRAGVTKAHRYEPELNPTYHDMAPHYGVAIVPARARKPKDKTKAEVGVQVVERWILAALRNIHRFCPRCNKTVESLMTDEHQNCVPIDIVKNQI